MKKIFVFIASAVMLAFGLSSCKNLHDADIPDLTGMWLHSNVYSSSWDKDSDGKYPSFVATDEENVYACEFTPVGSSLEFGFSIGSGFDWQFSGNFEITELDKEFVGKIPGNDFNSKILDILIPNATYRMLVTTTANGSATAKVTLAEVAPPDMFMLVNNSVEKMLYSDGTYTYRMTATGETLSFTIFDGEKTLGVKTAITLDQEGQLVELNTGNVISVSAEKGEDYQVIVTEVDNTIKVVKPFPNMTDWWLHSNVYSSSWDKDSDGKYPSFIATDEENVYVCEFTPVGSSLEFGFSSGAGFNWICGGGFEISELNKETDGSVAGGNNSHINAELTPDTTYIMTVIVKNSRGEAVAKVVKKE